MSSIPKSRIFLYGTLILFLVAALWMRTSSPPTSVDTAAVKRSDAPIRVSELQVAKSGVSTGAIGKRDVFRAVSKTAPAPVVAAPTAPTSEPKRPDPIEIAVEQAKKSLDTVRLIGVVASGEGALAVFEYDGNTHSRVVGDQIVSGFKLERISQGEIRARHERLGLVAVLSLGGVRPMQWTRVE